ncbi:hypothetical protein Tco_0014558 [Tanacetum coccineum]
MLEQILDEEIHHNRNVVQFLAETHFLQLAKKQEPSVGGARQIVADSNKLSLMSSDYRSSIHHALTVKYLLTTTEFFSAQNVVRFQISQGNTTLEAQIIKPRSKPKLLPTNAIDLWRKCLIEAKIDLERALKNKVHKICIVTREGSDVEDKKMMDEDKEIDEKYTYTDGSKVSTDRQIEGTDEQNEGTEEQIESTDGQRKGTKDHTEEGSATQATQTPTSTIFGDDETIAKVLLNMSQAKAVSREKEKGADRRILKKLTDLTEHTLTRSLLTLKPLPKIDPKDKGKKKIEEEDESESESDGIPEAENAQEESKEEVKNESKAEVQEESKEEESKRKRKLGTRKKMKSRKRRYIQNTSEEG